MKERKKALEFSVHPLWNFLRDNYGMEEAFRLFGPYKGASIKPQLLDERTIEVSMPLVLSNTNYFGTHFGGSLYSMCDPFYVFILMWNLGEGYMVWDKSAKIDFLKPGKGTVKAKFHISKTEIEEIRNIVQKQKKVNRTFKTEVIDGDGTIVAKIVKEIYIRRMV